MPGRPYLTLFGEGQPGVLSHGNGVYPAIPNESPTASFTGPTETFVGISETFESTSSDPDGSIVSHDWTFGDGTTASGETVSHTFETSDTNTVTLTVTDDRGGQDTASQTVSVAKDMTTDLYVDVPLDTNPVAPNEAFNSSWSLQSGAEIVSDPTRNNVLDPTNGTLKGNLSWSNFNNKPVEHGTFQWWVMFDSDPTTRTTHFWNNTASGSYTDDVFYYDGTKFTIVRQSGAVSSTGAVSPFTTDQWHHLVLTKQTSNPGWWEVWVDGEEVARVNYDSTRFDPSGSPVICHDLDGRVDSFRAYHGTMTGAEIENLYQLTQ